MCISWTNKEFEIINARYKHEENLFRVHEILTNPRLLFCFP
jgi:hypothetical protein